MNAWLPVPARVSEGKAPPRFHQGPGDGPSTHVCTRVDTYIYHISY